MSFLTRSLSEADPVRWPAEAGPEIETAVAEALAWLERVGLIMKDFGPTTGHLSILTRREKRLRSSGDVASYRDAAAFKAIEVAVRKASGFPDGELGVPLMRKGVSSRDRAVDR